MPQPVRPASRFYFPFLPWAVSRYRMHRRTARATVTGALLASRYLSHIRGRYHQQVQQELRNTLWAGGWWRLGDDVIDGLFDTTAGLVLLVVPAVAVAELARSTPGELVAAAALIVLAWQGTNIVLIPILSFSAWPMKVVGIAVTLGIGFVVADLAHHQRTGSTYALAAGIGTCLLLAILIPRSATDPTTSRVNWSLAVFLLFAPFLTASHLLGPAYSTMAVVLAAVVSLVTTTAVGLLVLWPLTLFGASYRMYIGAVLTAVAALVLFLQLLPRDGHWLTSGFRAGTGVVAAAILTMMMGSLLVRAIQVLLSRHIFRKDPEGEVCRGLLLAVFDLEYGEGWSKLTPPERADDRAAARWVRRVLAQRRRPLDEVWTDASTVHKLAGRLDSIIWVLDRRFADHHRVLHEGTNEFVRQEARRMAATVARWQRDLVFRHSTPPAGLVAEIVRCAEAATGRHWQLFERRDPDSAPSRTRRRALGVVRQVIIAVAPLVAVGVVVGVGLDLPPAVLGSAVTFAVSWLAASALRSAGTSPSESLDLTENLSRVVGLGSR